MSNFELRVLNIIFLRENKYKDVYLELFFSGQQVDLFSPELSVESLLHYDLKLHTNAWTLLSLFLHPSPNQNISLRGFEFSFPENEFYLPEEQFFCHIFFIMDSIFFSISFSMCSGNTHFALRHTC